MLETLATLARLVLLVQRIRRARWLILGALVAVAAAIGVVIVLRRTEPEPTFEPGLEFNPDFDLTEAEILADIRGESPSA